LATEAAHQNVKLAVSTLAASGYMNLLALDEKLSILKDTLKLRSESLRIAKHRTQVGYSPQMELDQAEADWHSTKRQIPSLELAIAKQEDALSVLLGQNPRYIERSVSIKKITIPVISSGLPSSLLRRRPDIIQAEQQIVAADKSLDAARAEFMPSFQLTANAGYISSSIINDPIRIFSIGGNVLAPIFEGGRLEAQEDVMTARRNQAAFNYRKVVLNAIREVDDAIHAVKSASDEEESLLSQKEALVKKFKQAKNRYAHGYSSYVEQIDAERNLLNADLTLVESRLDLIYSSISMIQALGGGWEFGSID
jgi:outer membrane protein, multidrug efflux system